MGDGKERMLLRDIWKIIYKVRIGTKSKRLLIGMKSQGKWKPEKPSWISGLGSDDAASWSTNFNKKHTSCRENVEHVETGGIYDILVNLACVQFDISVMSPESEKMNEFIDYFFFLNFFTDFFLVTFIYRI